MIMRAAWEAVRLINDLIKDGTLKRPRRTIRFIGWADEEVGMRLIALSLSDASHLWL